MLNFSILVVMLDNLVKSKDHFRAAAVLILGICLFQAISVGAESKKAQTPSPPDSRRIYSDKSYIEEFREIRDLWSAEIDHSHEIQALIKSEYPTLDATEKEKILDMVDDVIVTRHLGLGIIAATDPNLEPSYPVQGKSEAPYDMPKTAKQHAGFFLNPGRKSYLLLRHKMDKGDDFESKLVNEIEDLYKIFKNYCQSVEQLESQKLSGREDPETKMDCHKYCVELIQLTGVDAVKKLDLVLNLNIPELP